MKTRVLLSNFAACVPLCGLWACPLTAGASVALLSPAADTTLYQAAGDLANGSGTAMFAGLNSSSSVRRGLLRFDLAGALPAGAVIESVELRLFNSAANVSAQPVALHRVLESWGEGSSVAGGSQGSGGPATAGDATWTLRFYPSVAWSAPGGVFDALPSATAAVGGGGWWTWSSAAMASDVQSFLLDPAANFGWCLIGNESAASSAKRFATREEPLAEQRPLLAVTFVPGPSVCAVCAAGAVFLARRRRGGGGGIRHTQGERT